MDIWNFFFVTSLRITLRVTKITVHNETTFLFFVTLSYHKDTKKMHFEETMLGEHVGQMINSQLIASCRHVTSYNIEK